MTAGLGLAAASPAGATSYYNASGSVVTNLGVTAKYTTDPLVPQEVNLAGGNGWSVIATANDNDGGTVTADVGVPPNWSYGTGNYLQQISASSTLSYDFSVVGAAVGTIVQVLVYGAGHATQSDPNLGGYASTSFQLGGPGGDLLYYSIDTVGTQGATNGGSFVVNDVISLQVGYTYRLALGAYAKGASDESLDDTSMPNGKYATFSAGADPLFTILGDNALSYRFEGLPASAIGGPASAVPEPLSWVMMGGGFGFVGGAMRYRRRSRSPSCA
ncbi:PEPxxWA-CTERM sorting domain-containing protein [Sphingomonas sp. AP4-R1]|uniref:PEPxxWA-CTERM sorting domain-containing protein n=1 Tax=Sphingomonas sp. AP4-R1 TaxID=2735134 RepID=UPI0014935575|nr:PEPxxWA-CTERM sorting domain-containing protein [Sphingomonas sp. AP4-R1]QJU59038.1 PEPxxWA-CTERM sorting domain-containing protein [Sphingomonas sp. AP4-R1]